MDKGKSLMWVVGQQGEEEKGRKKVK